MTRDIVVASAVRTAISPSTLWNRLSWLSGDVV